jgi:Zn finger protein HypA/HybF involved in hydrogenase expression
MSVPEVRVTEPKGVPKSSFNCSVCMNTLAFEDLHIYYCPRCEAIWKIKFLRIK